MSDRRQQVNDLEPKLRRIAGAQPMRTDTDGNTSADPSITLVSADCRALLHEIEQLPGTEMWRPDARVLAGQA